MRAGLIWAATPLGVIIFDTGRRDVPFTRCEARSFVELGAAWDALPRTAQRALEADGINERKISTSFIGEYTRLARAAGW